MMVYSSFAVKPQTRVDFILQEIDIWHLVESVRSSHKQ